MQKTEIVLLVVVLSILFAGLWFVLGGKIWVAISWLETMLYPAIVTPT